MEKWKSQLFFLWKNELLGNLQFLDERVISRHFHELKRHSSSSCISLRFWKMASPVKSLIFKMEVDGSFCIHKKVKSGNYKSVADFWFEIESFVQFQGALNKHSGYTFQVHKTLGEVCCVEVSWYFSCYTYKLFFFIENSGMYNISSDLWVWENFAPTTKLSVNVVK